jgi:hypothetical protein
LPGATQREVVNAIVGILAEVLLPADEEEHHE